MNVDRITRQVLDYFNDRVPESSARQLAENILSALTWQPISTAPKDGTRIDLWRPTEEGGERIPDGYWGEAYVPWSGGQYKVGWCAANLGVDAADAPVAWDDDHLEPTHWMPTPEGPSDA